MEKLEEYGVYEMGAIEVLMFNGGGQQTPAWLISGNTAEEGLLLREGAAAVYGFFKGFLLG